LKKSLKKPKNFIIFSLALALFFLLSFFHEWANNFFIKLHFCDHTYCMIFSIIFFAFAYFAWKKKKEYLNMALIVLIVGIILMNLIPCDINGKISLKELFTTYPETEDCMDICVGWDVGYMSKVPDTCLEEGDLLVTDKVMLISKSLYISPCCCYNTDTCEDLGYVSRDPEADSSLWEKIEVSGLICWKPKEIIEPTFICCEMFNLDKEGKKTDIIYGWMTNDECIGMRDVYDGSGVVDGGFCGE